MIITTSNCLCATLTTCRPCARALTLTVVAASFAREDVQTCACLLAKCAIEGERTGLNQRGWTRTCMNVATDDIDRQRGQGGAKQHLRMI